MIVGLLCFYDEPPELLQRSVAQVLDAGADGVIAVDGPYELYPHGGKVRSDPECYEAICDTAVDRGKWAVTRSQDAPWANSEVGKRTELMRMGVELVFGADWLLVFDSDHFWETDVDLAKLLDLCPPQVNFARVSFAEVFEPDGTPIYAPARPLMRARADLRMGTNHYTYVLDDEVSTFLERGQERPLKPAFELGDYVRVTHGVNDRDPAQRARQVAFYKDRDDQGIET